jgi:threonine/homoserine/homoserine lactone efflux protein
VAALLASDSAFQAVQWLGAAYLAWLGARMLLAKPGQAPVLNIRPRHYPRQALITLLNPKAIVFYMAFPLFIDPARHPGLATYGNHGLSYCHADFSVCFIAVLLTHLLRRTATGSPTVSRALEYFCRQRIDRIRHQVGCDTLNRCRFFLHKGPHGSP